MYVREVSILLLEPAHSDLVVLRRGVGRERGGEAALDEGVADLGPGRVVALHSRSSTAYQIHEHIRYLDA